MKVVIIDDEPLISDKLKRIMETGLRGMHTVCAFTDAQMALDYIEQEKPGVILTDIRMPGITGIDLAKQINQMDYGAKIVFLTGYAEFEYAREAVHLEIEEYILKPVNANELSDCLKRLKDVLDKEREEKLNVRKLEQYYTDSLPVLQTNFFYSLIEGRITEGEICKFLGDYRISLPGHIFAVPFCISRKIMYRII